MSKSVQSCGTQPDHCEQPSLSSQADIQITRTTTVNKNNNRSLSNTNANVHKIGSSSNNKLSAEDSKVRVPAGDLIEDYAENQQSTRKPKAKLKDEWNQKMAGNIPSDNKNCYGLDNIEQLSASLAQDIVSLLPLHSIQVPTLENQIKNLQIIVDVPDEENRKERLSPKENKDCGSEKLVHDQDVTDAEKLVVTVDNVQLRKKLASQREKDILNEEKRAESPKENLETDKVDRIDFIRIEKDRLRNVGHQDKMKNGKREKKKKKNRRNINRNGDDGQDFDSLYRLPTEHLTRQRSNICGKDRGLRSVEEQLRLHEEINERRKMAELEKEMFGAVGGFQLEIDENSSFGRRRNNGTGNISPSSEHSRDSSPSNEESNVLRRYER